MAATVADKNLLEMLFEFFCPPTKPLEIKDINTLDIDEQLDIVKIERISSIDKRKQLTIKLFDKIPDLKQTAYKRIRFKSILSSYYKSYTELQCTPPQKWSKMQLSLSLFVYLIQELQRPNANAKDKKSAVAAWKFVYFTLKYCNDMSFDGEALSVFYNEVTQNGTKTGGFGLKFVQKICKKYQLKFGKFAKVKKKVGVWYTDSLNKSASNSDKSESKQAETPQKPVAEPVKPVSEPKPKPKPQPKAEYVDSAAKWYWMDMEELQWVPYTRTDQQVLNQAYANKAKRCDIVGGKYRVEFDVGSAAGNQFENNIADPINHMVVRAKPEDGDIHGITCASNPKT